LEFFWLHNAVEFVLKNYVYRCARGVKQTGEKGEVPNERLLYMRRKEKGKDNAAEKIETDSDSSGI
jgi:hypothetical protein